MARKVLVRLVDDLDGLPSEDVATVTFSLDRVTYQIDLNEVNAGKLRDGLAGFIAAARRTGGRIKRGAATVRAAGAGSDGPAIREWAREHGHQLAERGRIPSHIVDEFRAASRGGRKVAEPETATVTKARTRKAPATAAPAKTAAASRTASKATATAAAKPATRTRNAAAKTAAAKTAAAKTADGTAKAPKAAAAKTTEKKTTTTKTAAKAPRATATTGSRTRRTSAAKSR
jgi:hypothetical protein